MRAAIIALIALLLPLPAAIANEAIPILVEREDGSLTPQLDADTGLPVFEIRGVEYAARSRRAERTDDVLLLGPVDHDAYGPTVHRDATGRPFTYRTEDGDRAMGDVKRDAYGLGVHMDKFGRPVRATTDLWE